MICLLFAATFSAAGCSNYVKTHGMVVFSDDNTPLTQGTVILLSDTYQAKGEIRADGTFTIGSRKKADGLPPGAYRVCFSGTNVLTHTEGNMPSEEERHRPIRDADRPKIVIRPLIDLKYLSEKTSGIVYDTKTGPRLDIVVDRADGGVIEM